MVLAVSGGSAWERTRSASSLLYSGRKLKRERGGSSVKKAGDWIGGELAVYEQFVTLIYYKKYLSTKNEHVVLRCTLHLCSCVGLSVLETVRCRSDSELDLL